MNLQRRRFHDTPITLHEIQHPTNAHGTLVLLGYARPTGRQTQGLVKNHARQGTTDLGRHFNDIVKVLIFRNHLDTQDTDQGKSGRHGLADGLGVAGFDKSQQTSWLCQRLCVLPRSDENCDAIFDTCLLIVSRTFPFVARRALPWHLPHPSLGARPFGAAA
eukprot:scaffold1171_cov177-Amphora_coffeaeformis.AAC.25